MNTKRLGKLGYAACLAIVFVNLTYIFGMLAFFLAEDVFTDIYIEETATTYMVSPRAFILEAFPALILTYLAHKLAKKPEKRRVYSHLLN